MRKCQTENEMIIACFPILYILLQTFLHGDRKTQMLLECLSLWGNHQNWNLSFRNFLLKYEPRIKDKEPHDTEEKIYTFFFTF